MPDNAERIRPVSTGPSGSATGYLTALFRGGTLSTKSDSELLEQFIAARVRTRRER